jgi:hypothetical protein
MAFRKQSLGCCNQISPRQIHRRSQLEQRSEGRHVLTALDLAYVTALDPSEVGKCLLGDSASRSGGTNG